MKIITGYILKLFEFGRIKSKQVNGYITFTFVKGINLLTETSYILREDSSFILREDGSRYLREDA